MSDSEDSIDWLASDEDDEHGDHGNHGDHGTKTRSPDGAEGAARPPSPSSSSLRESPTSILHCGGTCRRRRRRRKSYCCSDCTDGGVSPAGLPTPAGSPVQGFTSVDTQRPLATTTTTYRLPGKRARDGGLDGLCEKPQAHTENELFSQKCSELQRYVQPLASILRGLRSGRYSQRLSSFQESVAMDRIQRIMGVLQNPDSGGRFLSIILKIEEMLHSWFPHVRAAVSHSDDAPAKKLKQNHCSASSPPPPPPPPPPPSQLPLCSSFSSTHLRWLHTSPICSLRTPQSTLGPHAAASSSSSSSSSSALLARCSPEVTQDNAVSSSTDRPRRRLAAAAPRHLRAPLPFKIRSPCLERLLMAKESIIAPRMASADGGWTS